ncbi:E3 ubiquitin-protein ligase DTX1-like [Haliotis rufescens]|uniref:E3 ubiquitin-protein ligase DTX1-like n=1 Tax=Haliotis rufescens TaxID=6454 RepID=UPI001EB08E1D|nr:E3 ubiquitin-protein ligase DTX1-like [Haliotis rufescens]
MATQGNVIPKAGFVVWEWLSEYGRWRPYDSPVTCQIEGQYGKAPQVYLGAVNQSLCMYIVDFTNMCQIRQGSGTTRPVRRKIYPQVSHSANQIAWQWSGDTPGSWNTYDFDVAGVVEDYYSRGQKILDLSATLLQLPYYINLSAMQQVRIETGTIRGIRRQILSVPYPLDTGKAQNLVLPPPQLLSTSSSTSMSSGVNKRTASSSSDSDSDGGLPNGSLRHLRSSRKKRKSRFHAVGSSSKTQSSSASLNIPNPSISMGHQYMMPPASNAMIHGLIPPSNRALQHTMNSNSVASSSSSAGNHGNSMFNLLPPAPSVSSTSGQLFQGPLTRSRYNNVASSSLAPSIMVSSTSGFVPSTSMSMMYHNSIPIGMSAHSQFMPSAANNIPLQLNAGKGRGSRISPVVSNMTNMLVSPAVPVAFSNQKAPVFPPPSATNSQQPQDNFPSSGRILLQKLRKSKPKTADEVLKRYLKVEPKPPNEDCCICYDALHEESSYGSAGDEDHQVVSLVKCTHMFHRMCLNAMYDSGHKDGSIQCPTCKTIYGERLGNCPPGEMEFHPIPHTLPGHPDCQAIRVVYTVNPGIQGPEHPNTGKRYSARGFPRVAYLPDNEKGRKVLKLLTIAWQRRLMFTIGVSTTTGEGDTVTWNEIHHKTEFGSNVSGHGYPDPNYLNNVTMELAVQGVCEDDLNS